ncbi:ATP-binding protein [Lysobacter korlensis]|uniref:ATP-binding protein n=1 Tax=Lysobacter korlensis TaxID=553636 RepID=A0ABV6RQZ0_9GAMM
MEREGGQWQVTEIDDATQIGSARRNAARLAEFGELPETAAGQLGLIAVELGTNLLKHAVRGRLFMRMERSDEGAVVDVVAIDHGPGMDLERCFHDGFSTTGTSGTGLGAVRRAASVFDAYSDSRGSVVFARLGTMPGPRRGSISIPLKGELESGDQWQFLPTPQGWSAIVVDGLGHGPGAATASDAVIAAHRQWPGEPGRCLTVAHERSHGTRGSACSTVAFDRESRVLVHAGIGNVAVVVIGLDDARGLASQNGTLGGICPTVRENRVEVGRGALAALHTDGLASRWSVHSYPGLRTRHPQVVAATLFRDVQRVRDDATVLVIET